MKRAGMTLIFLFVLIIGFSFFVSASSAVSCADLMASSGKSAETLCKVNYASQCCGYGDSGVSSSDLSMHEDYVCTDHPTAGVCDLTNEETRIMNEIYDILEQLDYDEDAWQIVQNMWDAQTAYRINVYEPENDRLDRMIQRCWDNHGDNCYDNWKAPWDAANLAEARYGLELTKQLRIDIENLPKKDFGGLFGGSSGGSAGSGTPSGSGLWNTNQNRGRDSFGKMMPSFGGYNEFAYVERADGTKVIPGHELYLNLDDSVKSGPGGKINIIFSQVGHVSLGENTELKVGSALLDQFYLAKGTLKSKVDFATPDKFEIDTPNSKVFVRGTEYIVDYNETTETTTIYLSEGTLEITAGSKNITLTEGNSLIINKYNSTKIVPMNAEEWEALEGNYLDETDLIKIFSYIFLAIIIAEFAGLVVLRIWTTRKIKKPNKKDKSTSKGTISLVLGILGLLLFLFPYLGIIASGVAMSLGRIQNANNPTKTATLGKILGIIGTIINALILLSVTAGFLLFR